MHVVPFYQCWLIFYVLTIVWKRTLVCNVPLPLGMKQWVPNRHFIFAQLLWSYLVLWLLSMYTTSIRVTLNQQHNRVSLSLGAEYLLTHHWYHLLTELSPWWYDVPKSHILNASLLVWTHNGNESNSIPTAFASFDEQNFWNTHTHTHTLRSGNDQFLTFITKV